jgi:hypothetical protein
MGLAAKLISPRIRKGRHLFVFMSTSAKSAAAKLCGKNAAPPRDARKNRVQADTFPSLSRVCA